MPTQIVRETRKGRMSRILNQRAEEQSRKERSQLLRQLHERAAKTRQLRDLRKASEDEKAKLVVDNPHEAELEMHEKVQAKIFLCIYPAAYVFEMLFLGALAEFLLSLAFSDWPLASRIGVFVVPALVLAADAYFGAQLLAARDAAFESQEENLGKYLWTAGCIGLVSSLAALAGYTSYLKLATQESFAWADMWLPLILATFSLFFHCAIVFGGERLRDAKAYLSYSRAHGKLERTIKHSTTGYDRERTAVSQVYRDYADALELYNNDAQVPVGAGPFDKDVVSIVNEIFGPVILPPPAQPDNSAMPGYVPPPADGASTNSDGSTGADPAEPFIVHSEERNTNGNGHQGNPFEAFRLDVDGRIRDAESEVTA